MSWRDRFRELADLREKTIKEAEKVRRRGINEMRETYKTYSGRVERVCREFANAVGWECVFPKSGFNASRDYRYSMVGSSWGRDNQYGSSIEVNLRLEDCRIFIHGKSSDYDGSREASREMSLGEFSEDSLAELILEIYKKIEQSLDAGNTLVKGSMQGRKPPGRP